MSTARQRTRILTNFAALPGGRARNGGPIIVISPTATILEGNGTLSRMPSTSDLFGCQLSYEDLVSVLGYFTEIPDEESLRHGFTVIIDGRKMSPRTLKTVLRACQQALYRKVRQPIIIQPEKFLQQQKINFDLMMEGYEFKTILTSAHKLSKYVDVTQLVDSLGGTMPYNPLSWCAFREKYDDVAEALQKDLSDVKSGAIATVDANQLESVENGEAFISSISSNPTVDERVAAERIRLLIQKIKAAIRQPEVDAEREKFAEEERIKNEMLQKRADQATRLLDWLDGPGIKWLLENREIGKSREEAAQLVRAHEQLETKSKEICEQAEELGELAMRLTATAPQHAITLEMARDQLLLLTKQYAQRVAKQSDMAKRSHTFHTQMGEFSRKTDSLLEYLCTDIKSADTQAAEKERDSLESKVEKMEKVYESAMDTGAVFIEDLSTDEKCPIGRPLSRDYSVGVAHVRQLMSEARERRKRCLELVDVRRLKLQQIIQFFTCERDAQQAIQWLEELQDTLVKEYGVIGCREERLRQLREDRDKLEETARSTYEYGKQLSQSALVLRRSLRLQACPQKQLCEKLEQCWARLCRALSENEAKISVTEAFNTTCTELARRIQEIERRESATLTRASIASRSALYDMDRRRLTEDLRELKHISEMLIAQANANRNLTPEERQISIAEIRARVEVVEHRARQLEDTSSQNHEAAYVRSAEEAVKSIRLSDTESYL